MSDEKPIGFEDFWTTEQRDYALISSGDDHYSIMRLSTKMLVIIEDDEVFEYVIQKMISMGNRRFSISEYRTYIQQSKDLSATES
jgi:hypothetical protein